VTSLPAGAEGSLELGYRYHNVSQSVVEAAEIGRRRHRATEALATANKAARAAIPTLAAHGCSVRDTALLLDMSPGRVSQVTAA
jgi:hypothetical protein